MALNVADLKFFESTNSLGGAITATEVNVAEDGFWDNINATESSAGDVEYRCLYARNASTTNTLIAPSVELTVDSTDPDTTMHIAVMDNVNETTAVSANESTEPAGTPTWTAVGVDIPFNADLVFDGGGAGDFVAIWFRRTVVNTTNAAASDGCTIALKGQTAA